MDILCVKSLESRRRCCRDISECVARVLGLGAVGVEMGYRVVLERAKFVGFERGNLAPSYMTYIL